ncbi:general secretion pathway protein C [Vibrio ponticus]|nr:general secretion pathway protein C [Vibrio ponticus]
MKLSTRSSVLPKLIANQARVSLLLTITLLLCTAWVLGRLVWFPYQQTQITPWKASASSNQATDARLDTANLYNSHLFGEYQAAVKPVVKPKLEDAPKSRLNIVVVGVVTSTNPQKSLAVVAKGGKQATYGINEVIEGTRAKLVQVQSDRIIVDNAGRNETVMLEGLKYAKPEPQVSTTQPTKANQVVASTDKLGQIRAEITSNPQQIFQYVRMSQLKRDGELAGYRLSPGKSRELFDSVGLKEGDVATHLNGKDLRNAAAMGEVFKSLPNLTELNLTVERDGQPYDIYIEL